MCLEVQLCADSSKIALCACMQNCTCALMHNSANICAVATSGVCSNLKK